MPIQPELLEIMTQTIVIENAVPVPNGPQGEPPVLDGYGRHYSPEGGSSGGTMKYGPPKTYRCRYENKTKVMATINGRDVVSSGRAYLAGYYPEIETECRVTVPKEVWPTLLHPVVMWIDNNYDEDGLVGYNTVVHFE
jgi:hypothetical protein